MKVLNLQCSHEHAFEGWFASEDDFQSQLARGLVECPVCADRAITKGLTAPRLNLGAQPPAPAGRSAAPAAADRSDARGVMASTGVDPKLQAAYLTAVRHILAHTEDVGERFAEEARRMHYGEADARNIRGQASAEETRELLDEGIDVLPLVVPDALKGPLQ
jgi:hypothetical protein